jgi:isopentenyldiphosphate isomerase
MDKSQVIVVNEKDEIIGHKNRNGIDENNIYRVTGLWVENSQGEILLTRRAFSKKTDLGKWGPAVSGTVEKGETYDSNMLKEAEEEIGLKHFSLQKGEKKRVSGDNEFFVQWYFAKLDRKIEDFKINKEEIVEARWFSREEVEKMIKENPEKMVKGLKRIPRL